MPVCLTTDKPLVESGLSSAIGIKFIMFSSVVGKCALVAPLALAAQELSDWDGSLPPAQLANSTSDTPIQTKLQRVTVENISELSLPKLSWKEVHAFRCIEDVRRWYDARRFQFEDTDLMLKQVVLDRIRLIKEIPFTGIPEKLDFPRPMVELEVEGSTYRLFGVAHTESLGEESVAAINRTIAETEGLWFVEQNLETVFRIEYGILLADNSVVGDFTQRGSLEQIFGGFLDGTIIAPNLFNYRRNYFLMPEHGSNNSYTVLKEFLGLNVPDYDGLDERSLYLLLSSVPIEIVGSSDLPSTLHLENKRLKGIDLNSSEIRSAYIANIVRNHPHTGAKNILIGSSHVAEIQVFLTQPNYDPKIAKAATDRQHTLVIYRPPEGIIEKFNDQLTRELTSFHQHGFWVGLGQFLGTTSISLALAYLVIKSRDFLKAKLFPPAGKSIDPSRVE